MGPRTDRRHRYLPGTDRLPQLQTGHKRDDIDEFEADLAPNDEGTVYLAKIIADAGLAQSAGEARRLIDGGGVKIDGEALPAKSYNVDPARIAGAVLQVGKRKFVRIR